MHKQRRITLILLFVIGSVSLVSLLSILHYFDPFKNTRLALAFLMTSFVFSFSSFLTIFLFIIKKIYYRGEVSMQHIFTSLRQSLLFSLFIIILFTCRFFFIPLLVPGVFSAILLVLIELLIKNIKS